MEPGIGLSPTEKSRMTHQKCSAAILVADVGKSPDVSEADGETEGGEEELAMVSPLTLLVDSRTLLDDRCIEL